MTLWAVKSMWLQHTHTHTQLDFEKFTAHSLVAGRALRCKVIRWSEGDPPVKASVGALWSDLTTNSHVQTDVSKPWLPCAPTLFIHKTHPTTSHTRLSQTSIWMLVFVFRQDSGRKKKKGKSMRQSSKQGYLFFPLVLVTGACLITLDDISRVPLGWVLSHL